MINCSPVMAYNEPKKRIEMVASKQLIKYPHLEKIYLAIVNAPPTCEVAYHGSVESVL
jgi:hypothetical protein